MSAPSREDFPWDRLILTLGLLLAEGASLGLLVRLQALPGLSAFLTKNTLALAERHGLLLALLLGGGVPVLVSLLAISLRGRAALLQIDRIARLLAPMCLLGLLPSLYSASTWHREPLTYLCLLALVTIVASSLLRMSLDAAPAPLLESWAERWRALPATARRLLPLGVVLLGSTLYCGFAGYYSIVFHHKFQTAGFDLGIYDNLMYNAMRGAFFRSPVLFGPKGGNYLAGHAEFVLVLFTPLYALWPSSDFLLWLQSFLFGFAAVPLYLFASTRLPRPSAAIVALCYLLFAPLHGPNFYDFHWLPCAIFFHFWLYYSLARERYVAAGILVLILFSIREDVAVGLAVLGLSLVLSRWRPRFGLALMIVSVAWFVIDKFVIMRWAGTWWFANMYKDLMATGESGYGSIIKTILINPVYFLSTLLKQDKLEYALHMVAPLALLPVRRPLLALLAFPGFFFTLMTTGYAPTVSIAFQYTTHWIPYLFAATVVSLYLISREPDGVQRRRAAVGALLLGISSHSYIFGFVFQQREFVGGFQRLDFTYPSADRQRYESFRRMISTIPRSASVAATENEVPHISNRSTAYTLREHHGDSDYLVIRKSSVSFGNTKATLKDAFSRNSYGLLAQDSSFYLFKRDHSSPETDAALNSLGITPAKTP